MLNVKSTPFDLLKDYFANHTSVLDIGCIGSEDFYCQDLTQFYLEGKFTTIVGIDYVDYDASKLFKVMKPKFKNYPDRDEASEFSKRKEILSYEKVNLLDENIKLTTNFDVIILGHILHFFRKKRRTYILEWCQKHLNKNGLLYLKFNHTESVDIINEGGEIDGNEETAYTNGFETYYLINEDEIFSKMKELTNINGLNIKDENEFVCVFKK